MIILVHVLPKVHFFKQKIGVIENLLTNISKKNILVVLLVV